MLLCTLKSMMAKCDLKKSTCIMRILHESHYTVMWSNVGLILFILNRSTGYFFCSISTWNYFSLLLWSVLYIWLYYALFDSNLTKKLVQVACYKSFSSYFHCFHDHTICFLFYVSSHWVSKQLNEKQLFWCHIFWRRYSGVCIPTGQMYQSQWQLCRKFT